MLIISVMFPLRLSVPSYWSSLHPLTSHPEAPGGGLIDRPVVCLDNTPPTSPVARVTDGFSLPKHFISISVTSDWWAPLERGGQAETPSVLRLPWQTTEIQTNSVQWVFVNVYNCDSVLKSITRCSTPIMHTILQLEHELTQKACQCLWGPVLWFTIIIFLHSDLSTVFWVPRWWKVGVCDLKPTGAGQKTAWRKLLLRLKRLSFSSARFCLSSVGLSPCHKASASNCVAISTVHHSHRQCPWHNWASAKWDGWHHPLSSSPIQSGSQTPMWSLEHD